MAILDLNNSDRYTKLYCGDQIILETGKLVSGSFIPVDKLIEKKEQILVFDKINKEFTVNTGSYELSQLVGEYNNKLIFNSSREVAIVDKNTFSIEKIPGNFGGTAFILSGKLINKNGSTGSILDLESRQVTNLFDIYFLSRIDNKSLIIATKSISEFINSGTSRIAIINSLIDKGRNIPIELKNIDIANYNINVLGTIGNNLYYHKSDGNIYLYNLDTQINTKIYSEASNSPGNGYLKNENILVHNNGNILSISKESGVSKATSFIQNNVLVDRIAFNGTYFIAISRDGKKLLIFDKKYNLLKAKDVDFNSLSGIVATDEYAFIESYGTNTFPKMVYKFNFSEKLVGYTIK